MDQEFIVLIAVGNRDLQYDKAFGDPPAENIGDDLRIDQGSVDSDVLLQVALSSSG